MSAETITREYVDPIKDYKGRFQEVKVDSLGENVPWENENDSEAFVLGQTALEHRTDLDTKGSVEISTHALNDRLMFLCVPTKSNEGRRIFKAGSDGKMAWLSEVTMQEDGSWVEDAQSLRVGMIGEELTVGRSDGNTGEHSIQIEDELVSGVHMKLKLTEKGSLHLESSATNGLEIVMSREKQEIKNPVVVVSEVPAVLDEEEVEQERAERLDEAEAAVKAAHAESIAQERAEVFGTVVDVGVASEAAQRIMTSDQAPAGAEKEQTPEDIIRDACSSSESLVRAMIDPETPQELKDAVNRLVTAHRELKLATSTGEVWDRDVTPILRKIDVTGVTSLEHDLQNVSSMLEQKKTELGVTGNNMVEAARHGADPTITELSRLKSTSDGLLDDIGNNRLKKGASEILNDQRLAGMRAVFLSEDIQQLASKLSKHNGPPEQEEIEELYASHGTQMRGAIESISALGNQLRDQAEERTPNWRRRKDGIDHLIAQIQHISKEVSPEQGTRDEMRLKQALEFVSENAQKITNRTHESNIVPQGSVAELHNMVGNAVGAFGSVIAQMEHSKALVRNLKGLLAEVQG